jgi:Leucine-rich repeat (LRR) protein
MFNGLFNLKNLILSDNPIESIEQDSFVELKHLEVLKYSKEQTEIFYDSDRKSKFFKVKQMLT